MKERPECSQRRIVAFAQCLGRSFGGGHGGLGIKTVAELVESNYFSNANDTHITNWSAYLGNIKD